MPKLLQINVTANWDSTGKIAEQINQAARQRGWDTYIAYGRRTNRSQSNLIKVGSGLSILEHGIESRLLDNHGLGSRHATKKLIKQIKELEPSIIHLHNIHGYYINYRLLFEYLSYAGIPVIWTLHDCWSFTGHCSHFVTAKCDKWRTECDKCPLIHIYPKSFFDRSKRNYKLKKQYFTSVINLYIITVSDWLSGLVNDSFLKGCRVKTIKNGISLDVFRPISHSTNERIRVVGVSSIWTKDKGLYDFYHLRKILDPQKYEIILIGLSRQQVKKLPEGIIGVERTDTVEQLVEMYSSADVFVNPTYADTFPTVNLEAMACGVPVLTYKTGGSPEAVTNETGWVVDQGDIEKMAQIIEGLSLRSESEALSQRQACRNRAKKEFDRIKCYNAYIELYEQLL